MGFGALIPLLVPLITELLKLLAAKIDKKPPSATYPLSTPIQGAALAPFMGVDEASGAVLGMAGSAVYEGMKEGVKWVKDRAEKKDPPA